MNNHNFIKIIPQALEKYITRSENNVFKDELLKIKGFEEKFNEYKNDIKKILIGIKEQTRFSAIMILFKISSTVYIFFFLNKMKNLFYM